MQLDMANPHLSIEVLIKRGETIAAACRARTSKGQQRHLRVFWSLRLSANRPDINGYASRHHGELETDLPAPSKPSHDPVKHRKEGHDACKDNDVHRSMASRTIRSMSRPMGVDAASGASRGSMAGGIRNCAL